MADMPPVDSRELDAPARLEALRRTDLMDSSSDVAFDRLTRLVTRVLDAPVSLVSLVDDRRQFFKSAVGLPQAWAAARGTPLSRSFCQHVVTADAPLVVRDARTDDRVRDNPAIDEADVVAYLGAPIHGPGGAPIGSLCAIAAEPRPWTDDDVLLLVDLAAALSDLVALRTATAEWRSAVVDLSHDVRTALSAVRLEADSVTQAVAGDDAGRQALQGLGEVLHQQAELVSGALQRTLGGPLGHEQDVDVDDLLDRIAREAQSEGGPVQRLEETDGSAGTGTVRVVEAELHRMIHSVVSVLLEHGEGDVTLTCLATPSSVRIRIADAGEGLPDEATWLLTGRTDGGGAGGSLAQRAAQRLGGRLVLVGSRPNVVDLLLAR